MEHQNITLRLRMDILRKAKHLAIERHTSLSALLTQSLEELVRQEEAYTLARRNHLALLEHGFDLSTKGYIPSKREELHDR
jgi:predicted transcriptional regulator